MVEAAKAGKVTEKSLLKMQTRVLKDTVALCKWTQIVDHIVPPGVDVFRIKKQWDNDKLEEAVLGSLRSWNSSASGTVDELIVVFREHELNALADEIIESSFGLQPVSSRLDPTNSIPVQVEKTQGIWFEIEEVLCNFAGRKPELKNLHELLIAAHSKPSSTENVICVHGLGGIGKTQFATKYAWTYGEHYDGSVVWINAESESSMEESFARLSEKLGLTTSSKEQIAAGVYEHFKSEKCLFIFDNVEEKSVLRKWQPKFRYPNHTIPHVLVTSRVSDLTPLHENQLRLNFLRPDESIELIQRLLRNSPKDVAEQLAYRLQHFPLALQQAVAYIRDLYNDDEEAIPRYLEEFDEREKELLDDDKFKELLNTEYWTTFTVWSVTLTRIEKLTDGPAAILLINMLAYLKPDSISVDFCKKILEAEIQKLQMGSFYSQPSRSSSQSRDDEDDKKENKPQPDTSSPYPGNTSEMDMDKTPIQGGSGGLICDPRSPNPEISRTPISISQGKDPSVNPLKGKKVLGFSYQKSAQ